MNVIKMLCSTVNPRQFREQPMLLLLENQHLSSIKVMQSKELNFILVVVKLCSHY